jgi:hypothetical protein
VGGAEDAAGVVDGGPRVGSGKRREEQNVLRKGGDGEELEPVGRFDAADPGEGGGVGLAGG